MTDHTLTPFPPNLPYCIHKDPFYKVYQDHLFNISHSQLDSTQVSNKHLDSEMFQALEHVNRILLKPQQYLPEYEEAIQLSQIHHIRLASASRSPWQQFCLTTQYKAKYLKSFHLLGLAVDLEMKGKPFDIRHKPTDPNVQRNYQLLEKILNHCGLVFSEPANKDPNHVELFRYCKKKNPEFDQEALIRKQNHLIEKFIAVVSETQPLNYETDNTDRELSKQRRAILLNDLKGELL